MRWDPGSLCQAPRGGRAGTRPPCWPLTRRLAPPRTKKGQRWAASSRPTSWPPARTGRCSLKSSAA
eukprot:3192194-Pleurochrysis_carterae.AAC.2